MRPPFAFRLHGELSRIRLFVAVARFSSLSRRRFRLLCHRSTLQKFENVKTLDPFKHITARREIKTAGTGPGYQTIFAVSKFARSIRKKFTVEEVQQMCDRFNAERFM